MTKPKSKLQLKVIVPLIAVGIAVILALLYTFVWRTSDGDYQTASTDLAATRTAGTTIKSELSSIEYSADIDDDLITNVEKAALAYRKSLAAFANDTAVTRDSKVKAAYEQYKGALETYVKTTSDFVVSMSAYRSVLHTCTSLVARLDTLKSASAFDTAAQDCSSAISAAKTSPDNAFNDQFLEDYLVLAGDLVAAYRKQVSSGSVADVTKVKQQISVLSDTKLTLSADYPTTGFQQLETSLEKQQKAFIR